MRGGQGGWMRCGGARPTGNDEPDDDATLIEVAQPIRRHAANGELTARTRRGAGLCDAASLVARGSLFAGERET
jgi:hypothetical protein